MSDLTFSQPERRSFLIPVLLALAAIALAIVLAIHFFPATTVNVDHIQTTVLPTETVFKGSTVVGATTIDRELFVASTIRVDNQLRVPIYLDDFHLTLTTPENAELTVQGFTERDLPDAQTNYPALNPLLTHPLQRKTVINPKAIAEGTVLFALHIPKELWDQRKSAVLKVDLYHQPSLYLTIPK